MKKHRFAFIYKYIILAAALACVLCFAFVFARYTTGSSTGVTADIASFDVEASIVEQDSTGEPSSSGIIEVRMSNNGDIAVKYMIEIDESYGIMFNTAAEGSVSTVEGDLDNPVYGDAETIDGYVVYGVTPIKAGETLYVKITASFTSFDASGHIDAITPGNGDHPETFTQDGDFYLRFSYEQAE